MEFVRSYVYHHAHGKQIVNSQAELDALGPGWCDSPDAAAAHAEAAAAQAKPAKAEKPEKADKPAKAEKPASDEKK